MKYPCNQILSQWRNDRGDFPPQNEKKYERSQGLIETSTSPWASPVVIARPKNGRLRLAIDYRRLNSLTINSHYPLPVVDDLLDRLTPSFSQPLMPNQDTGKCLFGGKIVRKRRLLHQMASMNGRDGGLRLDCLVHQAVFKD